MKNKRFIYFLAFTISFWIHTAYIQELAAENLSPKKLLKKGVVLKNKDGQEAFKLISDALSLAGKEWKYRGRALFHRGEILYNMKNYPAAAQDFLKATHSDFNFFPPHLFLSKALFKMKQYPDVLKATESAITVNPRNAEIHYIRGRAFFYLHDTHQTYVQGSMLSSAIKELSAAIEYDKKMFEAYFYRGRIRAISGKYEEAISDLLKATQINSKLYQAYFELGNIYLTQKNIVNSVQYYERCVQENPKYKNAYYGLIRTVYEHKMMDKAKKYGKMALENFPGDKAFEDAWKKISSLDSTAKTISLEGDEEYDPQNEKSSPKIKNEGHKNTEQPKKKETEIKQNTEVLEKKKDIKKQKIKKTLAPANVIQQQRPKISKTLENKKETLQPPPKKKEVKEKPEFPTFPENNWY